MIYRIVLSYACYGIIVENLIVIHAAPIARWMIGKNISFIEEWVAKKHGTVNLI